MSLTGPSGMGPMRVMASAAQPILLSFSFLSLIRQNELSIPQSRRRGIVTRERLKMQFLLAANLKTSTFLEDLNFSAHLWSY